MKVPIFNYTIEQIQFLAECYRRNKNKVMDYTYAMAKLDDKISLLPEHLKEMLDVIIREGYSVQDGLKVVKDKSTKTYNIDPMEWQFIANKFDNRDRCKKTYPIEKYLIGYVAIREQFKDSPDFGHIIDSINLGEKGATMRDKTIWMSHEDGTDSVVYFIPKLKGKTKHEFEFTED